MLIIKNVNCRIFEDAFTTKDQSNAVTPHTTKESSAKCLEGSIVARNVLALYYMAHDSRCADISFSIVAILKAPFYMHSYKPFVAGFVQVY